MALTPIHLSSKTTFSEIESKFSMKAGGKDQHLQTMDARELYTSDRKVSRSGVKALFNFVQQIGLRAAKRGAGAFEIKQSIEKEYGVDVGKHVFNHLKNSGADLTHGVKRSDLGTIRGAFQDLHIRASVASEDKTHGLGSWNAPSTTNTVKFYAYVDRHFDVLSSPEFFENQKMKQSDDFYGSTLSMSVINRIVAKGGVEQKDLVDLHRTLGPYIGPHTSAAPDVPDHLLGRLTDDTLKDLTGLVFHRYLADGADKRINTEGQPAARVAEQAFAGGSAKSGFDRLVALRDAHAVGIRNGQSVEPMIESLKTMADRNG